MPTMRVPSALAATPVLEIGLIICWSSGFVGGVLASETGTIFLVLFWRFMTPALILSPWTLPALARATPRVLATQALIGALAMFGYLAALISAIDLGAPAGLAALITAIQPLATAALAGVVLGEEVSRRQWLGLAVGLAGVGVAVSGGLGAAPPHAYGLVLISMACLTAATLIGKRRNAEMPLAPMLGVQTLAAAILFAPLAWLEGGLAPSADADFLYATLWLILLSTFAAYGFYWACLARTSATRVSSLIYLTPATTSLWAWAMFGQPIGAAAIAGFAICLLGIRMAAAPRSR